MIEIPANASLDLDQLANVTKSTMLPPIVARHAQLVNFQETLQAVRITDADPSNKLAMPTTKFNCHNNNVMDAHHALLDNNSTGIATNVLHQDQSVVVIKSTIRELTLASPAQ
jgi:hypothetical protein